MYQKNEGKTKRSAGSSSQSSDTSIVVSSPASVAVSESESETPNESSRVAFSGRPPCDPIDLTGRPVSKCLSILARNFANPMPFLRIDSDICCCSNEHISLSVCLPQHCCVKHVPTCVVCPPLLSVARMVFQAGYVQLSEAFRLAYPQVTYHSNSK